MASSVRGEIMKLILLKMVSLGVGVLSPFAVPYKGSRAFADFMKELQKDLDLSEEQVRNAINRLRRGAILSVSRNKDGKTVIKLSDKGRIKILAYNLETMKIERPKVWDGKYRVVIFDVPEQKKTIREYFRRKIQELGFVNLQKSVYVHPFATDDDLEFLRSNYDIRPYVQIILAEKIENDKEVRKKFKLK